MFLGWYDPDKKRKPREKLTEAVERYQDKFGRLPKFCLTSPQDATDLAAPSRKYPKLPVEVHSRSYIARYTFYVGEALQ